MTTEEPTPAPGAPVTPEQQRKFLEQAIAPRLAEQETYLAAAVAPHFTVSRADLLYVWDGYGNQYLDFASGGINPVGHRNDKIYSTLLDHAIHHGYTAPQGVHAARFPAEYARMLSETLPTVEGLPQQVLYASSGIEALAVAKRMARDITGRTEVVRSMKDTRSPAALVVEVLDDACEPQDKLGVQKRVDLAQAEGALIIVDETRTGFGRLGVMWAQIDWGIDADITVCGGPVGGGLPLGIVVSSRAHFLRATPVTDPMAGHPMCCAAGAAALGQIHDGLLAHVEEAADTLSAVLGELVAQFPEYITGVSGVGFLRGVHLRSTEMAQRLHTEAMSAGLLLSRPLRNIVELTPPLLTSENELKRGIDLMAGVFLDWS